MSSLVEIPAGYYVTTAVTLFFAMAIAWIAFARLTMARIERDMQRDGLVRPSRWDGVGARIPGYAITIACPMDGWNDPGNPIIDVEPVLRYATAADRKRAWAFIVTTALFAFVLLVGGFFTDLG